MNGYHGTLSNQTEQSVVDTNVWTQILYGRFALISMVAAGLIAARSAAPIFYSISRPVAALIWAAASSKAACALAVLPSI